MSPARGEALDLVALSETVDESGFELLGVELEVTGRLQQDGSPVLVVERTQQRFRLTSGQGSGAQASWGAMLKLQAVSGQPAKIRVGGPAKQKTTGAIELEVHSLEKLE